MKITNMVIANKPINELRAYFTLIEGSLLINSWRLLQRSNGEYFILPPIAEYIYKPTGEKKFSKTVDILDYDFESNIVIHAIAEYEKKLKGGNKNAHTLN